MHRYALLALALCLLAAAPSAPAAAQSSDSPIDDFFGNGSDDGGFVDSARNAIDVAWGFIDGYRDRVTRWVTDTAGLSDGLSASEAAEDLQRVANDNAAMLEAYTNARVNGSASYDVLALEFSIDGETATRYVTADISNGSYENASVVESTARSVDESCTLRGAAARNAAAELRSFVDSYVQPDKDVSRRLVSRIAAEYGGSIECTFI